MPKYLVIETIQYEVEAGQMEEADALVASASESYLSRFHRLAGTIMHREIVPQDHQDDYPGPQDEDDPELEAAL